MVITAVIVGYILGVAPFLAPFLYNKYCEKRVYKDSEEENKNVEDILNEYLNGESNSKLEQGNVDLNITPEDIFTEYTTGIPVPKGGN